MRSARPEEVGLQGLERRCPSWLCGFGHSVAGYIGDMMRYFYQEGRITELTDGSTMEISCHSEQIWQHGDTVRQYDFCLRSAGRVVRVIRLVRIVKLYKVTWLVHDFPCHACIVQWLCIVEDYVLLNTSIAWTYTDWYCRRLLMKHCVKIERTSLVK